MNLAPSTASRFTAPVRERVRILGSGPQVLHKSIHILSPSGVSSGARPGAPDPTAGRTLPSCFRELLGLAEIRPTIQIRGLVVVRNSILK